LLPLRRLGLWKRSGYKIEIIYLTLRSTRLALQRVATRVKQGGHNVPRADVVRRYAFAAGVGRGLRIAAKEARVVARRYGTPIYIWENGKVVAKRP
jgi:predicted ABC-type ATPase